MSCLLFHGPNSKMKACEEATRIGALLAPPFGDSEGGLTVEEAREAMTLLLSTPLGDRVGVIVLGPMDGTASVKASDALLKSLEEYPEGFVQPILWAEDVAGVPATIRSRCLEHWAGGEAEDTQDEEVLAAALASVEAFLKGDLPALLASLKILSRKEAKGSHFLAALASCLSPVMPDPTCRKIWDSLRPLSRVKDPTGLEITAALLGGREWERK